jgi:hypothetical protein
MGKSHGYDTGQAHLENNIAFYPTLGLLFSLLSINFPL